MPTIAEANRPMSRSVWFAAALVAVAVALVHLVSAGRYDFFANELYFIICGRHPALGYVDQPPLVPLLAAATQFGGYNIWLLRLPAVVAAVALVPLVVAFTQLLGGGTRAAWLAAVAAAASPMITALSAALSTSTFEPLAFTAVAYFVSRGVLLAELRAFWWAGSIAGIALEAKYGIVFWLFGIALGLLLFSDRSVWRLRDFWIGAAIAMVLALPNAAWQLAHGLPFLELVRNDNAGNLTGSPLRFLLDQLFGKRTTRTVVDRRYCRTVRVKANGSGAVSLGRVRGDGGANRRDARQRLLFSRRLSDDVRRGCRGEHAPLALVRRALVRTHRCKWSAGAAVRHAAGSTRATRGNAGPD